MNRDVKKILAFGLVFTIAVVLKICIRFYRGQNLSLFYSVFDPYTGDDLEYAFQRFWIDFKASGNLVDAEEEYDA